MNKIFSLVLVAILAFAFAIPAVAQPTSATLKAGNGSILTVHVNQLTGNTNDLVVDINGAKHIIKIPNNASGTYDVDGYKIFVDTKGNTQIRDFRIISEPGGAHARPPHPQDKKRREQHKDKQQERREQKKGQQGQQQERREQQKGQQRQEQVRQDQQPREQQQRGQQSQQRERRE